MSRVHEILKLIFVSREIVCITYDKGILRYTFLYCIIFKLFWSMKMYYTAIEFIITKVSGRCRKRSDEIAWANRTRQAAVLGPA